VKSSAIEETCKALAIPPTGVKPDGSPHYTLPAIIDRTKAESPVHISDSRPIIEYLEKTYPARGSQSSELFPKHAESFQSLFMDFVMPKLMVIAPDLVVKALYRSKTLDEQLPFLHRMERLHGKPFDELEKQGEERIAVYRSLEQSLTSLKTTLDQSEGEFLTGNQVIFSDLVLAAWLIWLRWLSPDDIWPRIAVWNDGRWVQYVRNFEQWMSVE